MTNFSELMSFLCRNECCTWWWREHFPETCRERHETTKSQDWLNQIISFKRSNFVSLYQNLVVYINCQRICLILDLVSCNLFCKIVSTLQWENDFLHWYCKFSIQCQRNVLSVSFRSVLHLFGVVHSTSKGKPKGKSQWNNMSNVARWQKRSHGKRMSTNIGTNKYYIYFA